MDFLYGNKRKILKIVYKNYKKNTLISRVDISSKLKLDIQSTTQICRDLRDDGFITFVGIDTIPKITPKGIDYFSEETSIAFETISKSIICPIIVSFITTLLTLMLKERL